MTDKLRDAAQQALEVLEDLQGAACKANDKKLARYIQAIAALRAALAQQDAQETSIYRERCADGMRCLHGCHKSEPCHHTARQAARSAVESCEACFGKGVEGDADDRGHTIDVTCGNCDGTGIQQPTKAEVIARCAAAGIRWIEPDDDPDGYPGGFDMCSLAEMRRLLVAKPSAQQDGQAVPQGYVLAQINTLKELKASISGNCYRGSAWEVETISALLNAAPTPPARATLTASEILNMTPESIPAEHDGALLEYARAVIEAYKRKNGISQPGYTAPDMASQGASQFRAGHDATQSEIAELEQENRLLRARNDRLQKEIEQKGER